MSDAYVTVLIASAGNEDMLKNTLDSIAGQENGFADRIRAVTAEYEVTPWKAYEQALKNVATPYVMMIEAGDCFLGDTLERGWSFLESHKETDAVMFRGSYEGRKSIPAKADASLDMNTGVVFSLEKREDAEKTPNCYEAVLLRTQAAREETFEESYGYETREEYLYRILDKKKKLGYIRQAVMLVHRPIKRSAARNKDNIKKDWYLDSIKGLARLKEQYGKKYGSIPVYIQYRMLYELKIRFESNKNRDDKHALNEEEWLEFCEGCKKVLSGIEDDYLHPTEKQVYSTQLSYALSKQFLDLKYGGENHPDYRPDAPTVYLDLTNFQEGKLVLDFSYAPFSKGSGSCLCVLWNGKEIPCVPTVRYAHTEYFSRPVYHDETFRVTLSCKEMGKHNRLSFAVKRNGETVELPVSTRRYTSRITPEFRHSYWCFDRFMMYFDGGRQKKEIIVESSGLWKHLKRELRLLMALGYGKDAKKELYRDRLQYWKAWPRYHRKNIWLTFDKIYKGGDNGEYFYKYMMTRKDTDVVPQYLINEDAPDRERLEKEGYEPLIYGSRKHRVMFLHAKMIFATHAGIYNFNHISQEELPYLQDLMNAEAACIQHGLSVQDLTFNAHRAFNNNKRYYCASKYEVENLLQPLYGYDDPSVIRLTGVPRYDGLVNRDQRQILITPTWRSYIALPAAEKNNTRPYFEGFKETDYFKVYNELISDRKLLETARRTGYKILFLVHPNISAQTVDYTKTEGVEIVSALDVNYEKVLTQSSLMVTDYSGVQFDFAYMRKPVVYYHSPKLPPHYVEGGFFYDTQGFGEICREQEELVEILCGYMEQDCRIKPFYEARENDFFAFDDHENCRRIFEDALEYQKKIRR